MGPGDAQLCRGVRGEEEQERCQNQTIRRDTRGAWTAQLAEHLTSVPVIISGAWDGALRWALCSA